MPKKQPKTSRKKKTPPYVVTRPTGLAPGHVESTVTFSTQRALTTGQAAAIIGMSDQYVKKLCVSGILPHWQTDFGGDRRIWPRDLVNYMRSKGMRIPQQLCEYHAVRFGVNANEFPQLQLVDLVTLAEVLAVRPVTLAVIGDLEGRQVSTVAANMIRSRCPHAHITLYASEDWRCDVTPPWSAVANRGNHDWVNVSIPQEPAIG